jgi:hypothetical protein
VIEIRPAAVPPLALTVRKPADGEQIWRFEESYAICEIQALARLDFVRDLGQAGADDARLHLVIG